MLLRVTAQATAGSAPMIPALARALAAALATCLVVSCAGTSVAPSPSASPRAARGVWNVSGSVTAARSGSAIAGVTVVAYRAEQDACCSDSGSTVTDRGGRYALSLPVGDYRIHFKPAPGSQLGPQWWQGGAYLLTAAKVSVKADVTGVDATLSAGEVISGSVVQRVGRSPLPAVGVFVYESFGPLTDQRLVTHTRTDTAGRYSAAVPAGTFRVSFVPPAQSGVVAQWWPNAVLAVQAGDITVPGAGRDYDIAMAPGVLITGRVRDARTGAALARVRVLAVIGCCDTVAISFTDNTGVYQLFVGSGTYRVYFLPAADSGYREAWWRNAAAYAGSADVLVGDSSVRGIDADLERR